jgi:hypothetical protein
VHGAMRDKWAIALAIFLSGLTVALMAAALFLD